MKQILTIDVEDWYHILEVSGTTDINSWSRLESRVEKNFIGLLDILDENNVKATCFFLGWIAEKYPHLVKEACKRGHEAASHGYGHSLVYSQSPEEFRNDIDKTKKIIEDIAGQQVLGFRAPGFSITPQCRWALDELHEAGYTYDSSLFPAKRGHGYFLNIRLSPFIFEDTGIIEFPISVASIFGKRVCFFGGGYLRLFPYFIIKKMRDRVLSEGRPVLYYIHPREIDPSQPRLNMNFFRKFKSYVNLSTTERKLRRIASEGEFCTIRDFIDEYPRFFAL